MCLLCSLVVSWADKIATTCSFVLFSWLWHQKDPISNILHISRHVIFWENIVFLSLSTFHHALITDSFYFTNTLVELFPSFNADNFDEFNTLSPSPTSTEPIMNLDIVPASHHSTRVSNPHPHLNNYHWYYSIKTLHELSSYREASTDHIWQQAMSEEIRALKKIHTSDLVNIPSDKNSYWTQMDL